MSGFREHGRVTHLLVTYNGGRGGGTLYLVVHLKI